MKKKLKCTACGQKGHWHGDPECPKKGLKPEGQISTVDVPPPPSPYNLLDDDSDDDDGDFTMVTNDKVAFVVTGPSEEKPPAPVGRHSKDKSSSSSSVQRSGKPTADTHFAYGPFKCEQCGHVAASRDKKHADWIDTIIDIAKEKRAKYQEDFVQYLIECGKVVEEEVDFVSAGTAGPSMERSKLHA